MASQSPSESDGKRTGNIARLVPNALCDLPADYQSFLEKDIYPTLLPAVEFLLHHVEETGLLHTSNDNDFRVRPTSAPSSAIRALRFPKSRPGSAPPRRSKFNPLHFLASHLMRHNPNPQLHSWAEKMAHDERRAQAQRMRDEAERKQRLKLEAEVAAKAEIEKQRQKRAEEEARVAELARIAREAEEAERLRLRMINEAKRKEEEERLRLEDEERRKQEDEERERQEAILRKKREKEEQERIRKEKEEAFMRRQREIKAFEIAVTQIKGEIRKFRLGDDVNKVLVQCFRLATEAAKRMLKATHACIAFAVPENPNVANIRTHSDDSRSDSQLDRNSTSEKEMADAIFGGIQAPRVHTSSMGDQSYIFGAAVKRAGGSVLGAIAAHGPAAAPADDLQRLAVLAETVGWCINELERLQRAAERDQALKALRSILSSANGEVSACATAVGVLIKQLSAQISYVAAVDAPNVLRLIAAECPTESASTLPAIGSLQKRPAQNIFSDFGGIDAAQSVLELDMSKHVSNVCFSSPKLGWYLGTPVVDPDSVVALGVVVVQGQSKPPDQDDMDFVQRVSDALVAAMDSPVLQYIRRLETLLGTDEAGGNVVQLWRIALEAIGKHTTASSAYIAVMDGHSHLDYVAATPSDEPHVLGKRLVRPSGVSWPCLDAAKASRPGNVLFLPSVQRNSAVYYFREGLADSDIKGSYMCIPLLDKDGDSIGLIGLDTLQHGGELLPWDCVFGERLARALGPLYERAERRRRMLLVLEGALMMFRTKLGPSLNFDFASLVPESTFETAILGVVGERVYGFLSLDTSSEALSSEKRSHMELLARLLVRAFDAISSEKLGKEPADIEGILLDAQRRGVDDRMRMLIPAALLKLAREEIQNLDPKYIAEIKNYNTPPKIIHKVLKSVQYLLGSAPANIGTWNQCRGLIGDDLKQRIIALDPTAVQKKLKFKRATVVTKGLALEDVHKHGSLASAKLFSWVSLVLTIRTLVVASRKLGALSAISSSTSAPVSVSKEAEEEEEGAEDEEGADEDILATFVES
mmetsp:Transcript_32403/g.52426  ORF Transcript_32403/g.52426 Transcript_32403/m.52426 type:complete len:1041 (-) Transcript_32403:297-3419(-)|eukprot:CAMPEP_0184663570 /NCGR_PEP_ID=MMETSP0308-20130426/48714_1 /TAXON_ID=38269 /ORGANISM="Gloeochaete witrockiana, Strain SAG 46.84" /LENGTH=1040 /DNA_ID=CAMNT_0027106385 /DNA_START=126 /DNA_END=3248 /DNA_ORIENTATION=+